MVSSQTNFITRSVRFLRELGDRGHPIGVGLLIAFLFMPLLSAIVMGWIGINLASTARSYATGAAEYARWQKMAVLDLYRYAYTGDPEEYAQFRQHIETPVGDRIAREALTAVPTDFKLVKNGLLQKKKHPDDFLGEMKLFRQLFWRKPFAQAIQNWETANAQVAKLVVLASSFHRNNLNHNINSGERDAFLVAAQRIDHKITKNIDLFTAHMDEAAHRSTSFLIWTLAISTSLFWGLGFSFAVRFTEKQFALHQKLSFSEERFRDYSDVASDWYWESTKNGKVAYLSIRFSEVMSITPDILQQKDLSSIIRD